MCPQCRNVLPIRPPCTCGFVLRECDGVLQLMTQHDIAAVQPFLDAYERVRSSEQWGGDDLDLPFHPKRHHDIWSIRRRTFRAFESVVASVTRGVALDIGAGNCWMTRYIDRWGFDAIAVDINVSTLDGLCAGQRFIDAGAVFLRVRAAMERLPFASSRIRLIATNASFHYGDFRAALAEFERVLTPGGMVAIIDTPFYEDPADGERMLEQRIAEFRHKYAIPEGLARKSSFMTHTKLHELAREFALNVRVHHIWPGVARWYQQVHGRLTGRRIAEFPLVVFEKNS